LSQKDAGVRQGATWGGLERRQDSDSCACAALRFLSDQLGYAVLVSSRDNQLLHANSAGGSLLSGDSPFVLSNELLIVQGMPAAQWLATLPAGPPRARCVVIKHRAARSRQNTDYRVAVTHGVLKRSADPVVFCVYSELSQRQIDSSVLRALYDLTPAEAATAVGVFGGSTLAELARERCTSIHTVRTQLKRVLLKCQVRSQLELCRLLATGPGVF
jgi:DNA-binding CsgD family transcriptional regulator